MPLFILNGGKMARNKEADTIVGVEIPKVDVTPAVTVTTTAVKAKEAPKVEIVTNETFKVMFGDRWYYFTKGEPTKVSAEMKAFLLKQGALAVI